MYVDTPLTKDQLSELHSHLKVVGAQFLQRVDAFAAIDLQEKIAVRAGDIANIRTGLQCFLFVEPVADAIPLRDAIEFNSSEQQ
jgi:hypothetical protein